MHRTPCSKKRIPGLVAGRGGGDFRGMVAIASRGVAAEGPTHRPSVPYLDNRHVEEIGFVSQRREAAPPIARGWAWPPSPRRAH
jgi:hypothetical protein